MLNSKKPSEKKTYLDRRIPDYTGDFHSAKDLVKRIQDYWHNLGYTQVKVWIETVTTYSGNKLYCVRSNIRYNCNSLE